MYVWICCFSPYYGVLFWGVFDLKWLAKQFIHFVFLVNKCSTCLLLRTYADVVGRFMLWIDWSVLCTSVFVARNGSRRAVGYWVLFFYCLKMGFCDGHLIFFRGKFLTFWAEKCRRQPVIQLRKKGISVEENMFSMFRYGTFCRKMFHAKHLFYLTKLCYT